MKHSDQESLSCLMDGEWRGIELSDCIDDACRDEALSAKWARYHLVRDVMRREPLAGGTLSIAERVREQLADEPTHSNVTAIFGTNEVSDLDAFDAGSDNGAERLAVGGAVAVRDTPAESPVVTRRAGSWGSAFGGVALAASVAFATVLGLNAWRGGSIPALGGESEGGDVRALAAGERVAVNDGRVESGLSLQIEGVPLPEVDYVSNSTGAFWSVAGTTERRTDSEDRLNMLLSRHIEHSPTAERNGMLPYSRLVGYEGQVPGR